MDQENNSYEEFEETLETSIKDGKYILRLFIAGINPKSKKALENLMEVIDKNLKGKYELEVIDIYQQPIFAKEGRIIAAPTLIKELPLPIRRFVGDLSDKDKLLLGLDIRTKKKASNKKSE
jgi:circadian clock protein KaiB